MISKETKNLWLAGLRSTAAYLETLYRHSDWSLETEFRVEREIFLGFYAVRKLLESKHMPPAIHGMNVDVLMSPLRAPFPSRAVPEKWHQHYELLGPKSEPTKISVEAICNQFIHSVIYSPFVPEGLGCMGVFVVSDRNRDRSVCYIRLVKVIEIFLSVAAEKVVRLEIDTSKEGQVAVKLGPHLS